MCTDNPSSILSSFNLEQHFSDRWGTAGVLESIVMYLSESIVMSLHGLPYFAQFACPGGYWFQDIFVLMFCFVSYCCGFLLLCCLCIYKIAATKQQQQHKGNDNKDSPTWHSRPQWIWTVMRCWSVIVPLAARACLGCSRANLAFALNPRFVYSYAVDSMRAGLADMSAAVRAVLCLSCRQLSYLLSICFPICYPICYPTVTRFVQIISN